MALIPACFRMSFAVCRDMILPSTTTGLRVRLRPDFLIAFAWSVDQPCSLKMSLICFVYPWTMKQPYRSLMGRCRFACGSGSDVEHAFVMGDDPDTVRARHPRPVDQFIRMNFQQVGEHRASLGGKPLQRVRVGGQAGDIAVGRSTTPWLPDRIRRGWSTSSSVQYAD